MLLYTFNDSLCNHNIMILMYWFSEDFRACTLHTHPGHTLKVQLQGLHFVHVYQAYLEGTAAGFTLFTFISSIP